MKISNYSKAIVAILGVGITTALDLITPDTDLWMVLKIVSAMLTAAGVYLVPNTSTPNSTLTGPGLVMVKAKKGNDFSDIELADGPRHSL